MFGGNKKKIEELEVDLQTLKTTLETKDEELKVAQQKIEELNQKITDLQAAHIEAIESKETAYKELQTAIEAERKEMSLKKDQLLEKYDAHEKLTKQVEQKQETLQVKEQQLQTFEQQLFEQSKELTEQEEALSEREAKIIASEQQLASKQKELEAKKVDTSDEAARHKPGDTVELSPPEGSLKKTSKKEKQIDVKRLPNGMVGTHYQATLDLQGLGLEGCKITAIDGLEELGLHFDPNDTMVFGKPTKDGEPNVTIHYKRINSEILIGRTMEVPILILPDPKSLWKNIPPPADAPFQKGDEQQQHLDLGGVKMIGASKRGRSHAHEGSFREDHFTIGQLPNDWIFMAAADGAGSAEYSREGSRIACEVTFDSIQSYLENADEFEKLEQAITQFQAGEMTVDLLKRAFYPMIGNGLLKTIKNLEAVSKALDVPVKQFSTTLLMSVSKQFDFGFFNCCYWIGDGAAAFYTKGGEQINLLGSPDGGDYAGQTRFLAGSEISYEGITNRMNISIEADFTALILMTDGVSDPKFQTDNNMMNQEYWDKLWGELEQELPFDEPEQASQSLVKWLDFWSQGNHDDRTITILYK